MENNYVKITPNTTQAYNDLTTNDVNQIRKIYAELLASSEEVRRIGKRIIDAQNYVLKDTLYLPGKNYNDEFEACGNTFFKAADAIEGFAKELMHTVGRNTYKNITTKAVGGQHE